MAEEEKQDDGFAKYINDLKAFAADYLLFRRELLDGSKGGVPEEQMAFLFDSFKKDIRTAEINTRGNNKTPTMCSSAQIDYIRGLIDKKEGSVEKVEGFLKSLEKTGLTEKDKDGKDVKMLLTAAEASQLITELKELNDKPRRGGRGY